MLPPNLARALAKGTVMSCFCFLFSFFFLFLFLSFFFFFFFFFFFGYIFVPLDYEGFAARNFISFHLSDEVEHGLVALHVYRTLNSGYTRSSSLKFFRYDHICYILLNNNFQMFSVLMCVVILTCN